MDTTDEAFKRLLSFQAVHPHSRGDTQERKKKDVALSPLGVGTTRLKRLAAVCVCFRVTIFPASSEQFHLMLPGIILWFQHLMAPMGLNFHRIHR